MEHFVLCCKHQYDDSCAYFISSPMLITLPVHYLSTMIGLVNYVNRLWNAKS